MNKSGKFLKEILFTVIAVVGTVLLLEGALYLASPFYIEQQKDKEPKSADVTDAVYEKLPETITYHIQSNALTQFNEELIFSVRPNPGGAPVNGYTGINRFGFRGPVFDSVLASNEKKIMILGDSCAFGWGILDYSDAFANQLQQKLDKNGKELKLYNFGQPGYSSYQGMLLFDRWFAKVKPDTLILYFGWNNLWESDFLNDEETVALLQLAASPMVKRAKNSSIYKFAEFAINKVVGVKEVAEQQRRGSALRNVGSEYIRVPITDMLDQYDHMIKQAKSAGTKVIVIAPPFSAFKFRRYKYMSDLNRVIYGKFKEDVYFPDLARIRPENPISTDSFIGDGFHPNKDGAEYIANALYDIIVNDPAMRDVNDWKPAKGMGYSAALLPKLVGSEVADATSLGGTVRTNNKKAGVLVYGPYAEIHKGHYKAVFAMKVSDTTKNLVAKIDVATDVGKVVLIERLIKGSDFNAKNEWMEFTLPFEIGEGGTNRLEFRVLSEGGVELFVDTIRLDFPFEDIKLPI